MAAAKMKTEFQALYTKSDAPFDREKFFAFMEKNYPQELIRAKGYMWFSDNDKEVILFEQEGHNATVTGYAVWIAAMQDGEGYDEKEILEQLN